MFKLQTKYENTKNCTKHNTSTAIKNKPNRLWNELPNVPLFINTINKPIITSINQNNKLINNNLNGLPII